MLIDRDDVYNAIDTAFVDINKRIKSEVRLTLGDIKSELEKSISRIESQKTKEKDARTICIDRRSTTEITTRFIRSSANAISAVAEYDNARDAVRRGEIPAVDEQLDAVVKWLSLNLVAAELLMETMDIREKVESSVEKRLRKSANKIRNRRSNNAKLQ